MTEVYPALGSTVADGQWFDDYSTAAEMANDILNRWMSFQSVTLGFLDVPDGVPLVSGHAYTLYSVNRDARGTVVSFTLRNPWAVDGIVSDQNPNDGLVTLTPDELFDCFGQVQWGVIPA